jgi:hypothetical protein
MKPRVERLRAVDERAVEGVLAAIGRRIRIVPLGAAARDERGRDERCGEAARDHGAAV